MTEIELPLSVGNIRKLEQGLKRLAREFSTTAESGRASSEIETAYANLVAEDVRNRIQAIPRSGYPIGVDGNVDGIDPPNVTVEGAVDGKEVVWRGTQVRFVEFGTGAAGAGGFYPSQTAMAEANYHPDPTKKSWWYPYNGYAVKSYGLAPQAPMATAALMAEVKGYGKTPAVTSKVTEAVARAIGI